MTADSLPSRTAAALGVEPKPAADARLILDLTAQARASGAEHLLRQDLESIERAFGRQIRDERARPGIRDARARAARLGDAAGSGAQGVALAFAADLFVCLAVERHWSRRAAEDVLSRLADVLDATPGAVGTQLLSASARAPQLFELPPAVALEVQLSMLVALSGAVEASLWIRDQTGRAECLVSIGDTAATRRFRAVAGDLLDGRSPDAERATIDGVPVRRWQAPWAALVARAPAMHAGDRTALAEVAEAMSPLLEREFLLQRNAARERSLVAASERRLSRLGFDLHDGALQQIALLGADLRQLSEDDNISALAERVVEIDRVLRELAHSLEPASLVRRPLESVIDSEAASLRERAGVEVSARVHGDFKTMTQSQKIALIRVVQEALSNVREHSNATAVQILVTASRSSVDVKIQDNGDGFEVTRTLQDAAQRGRLGLVGSSERIRLLGGTFDIRSRPGGPTTVLLSLPRWQALPVDERSEIHA